MNNCHQKLPVHIMETSQINQQQIHIRSHLQPGDIGSIIYLHGILYAKEYGLDHTLEGYVAAGLAQFVQSFDARKDGLWIAEMERTMVGSIGIMGQTSSEAQLRWFLVRPANRGRGLGRRLLNHAQQFCRERNFKSVFLWTFSDLEAAAHLYCSVGFQKTEQNTHQIWGRTLTEERYDLFL